MGRITHVTYQRVQQTQPFEPERIEATAEVELWEDPDEVLANLRVWVDARLRGNVKGARESAEYFAPYTPEPGA